MIFLNSGSDGSIFELNHYEIIKIYHTEEKKQKELKFLNTKYKILDNIFLLPKYEYNNGLVFDRADGLFVYQLNHLTIDELILLWNDFIIDGAGRQLAVKEMVKEGDTFNEIPVVYVEAKDLNKAQSILNKAFSFYKDPYKSTSGDHGKSAKFDPNGTDLAVESISTDGQVKTRPITWVKNNHQHYNKPKVIMPMYGKTAIVDYSHKLVSAAQEKNGSTKLTGHNIQTVITNSDQESETLVSILESRLQRFFNTVTNENRSQYINFLKNFKGVPLNQSYTDDTLEKDLGLTKDESKWLRDNY
jgi:hypothetical protein